MPQTLQIARSQAMPKKWLGEKCPDKANRLFLQVPLAEYVKSRNKTDSKHNPQPAQTVCTLLAQNRLHNGANANNIKIVTPYKDQMRLLEQVFKHNAADFGLPSHKPKVMTLDQIRAHQTPILIYDLTVTCGDKSHAIGIVGDEARTNIALTRATETLIVVGSPSMLTTFPSFWEFFCAQNGMKNEPLPYIVEFARQLQEQNPALVPILGKSTKRFGLQLKEEWNKQYDGHFD